MGEFTFSEKFKWFRGQNGGYFGPKWAKFGTFTIKSGVPNF